ncbi:MAG: hypothetical protein JNJ73_08860 [Hyphomonadaceae bacterium]|nr:hypothetical protein [Hyphomonadaceae bacterium]
MRRWMVCLLALGGLCLSPPAAAQQAARLFSQDDPLELTIEAPISDIIRNAQRNTDPHAGSVRVNGGPPIEMRLSARGLTRRTGGICAFPPLRLEFDGPARRGTIFQGQGRLKLVTHCKPIDNYEQRVVLEYLAYRLYNVVTPLSYRVRAARITYVDTAGRRSPDTRFGFLIEDVDDVARRNNRTKVEAPSVAMDSLDSLAASRAALYQYMIGNLDWSFTRGPAGEDCCHNTRPIGAAGAIVPLPYDFDQSGFVDAPYALPPQGIRIASVRTRVFRGLCQHNASIPAAAAEFTAKRADIMALIGAETRLPEDRRRSAQRYLEGFFEAIDPSRLDATIIRSCRGAN